MAKAVEADQPAEYEESFRAFRRATLLSDDLIGSHAKTLVKDVKEKLDAIMGPALTSAGEKRKVPKLEAFNPFA